MRHVKRRARKPGEEKRVKVLSLKELQVGRSPPRRGRAVEDLDEIVEPQTWP
jgi:hypothetical protein